jgi:hypothetical protein
VVIFQRGAVVVPRVVLYDDFLLGLVLVIRIEGLFYFSSDDSLGLIRLNGLVGRRVRELGP